MVLIAGVEYLDPELVVSLSPAAPQDMMWPAGFDIYKQGFGLNAFDLALELRVILVLSARIYKNTGFRAWLGLWLVFYTGAAEWTARRKYAAYKAG